MTVLVTGAAGFIGFHVCQVLLARGDTVVGVDNLNDYYDVNLKKARLAQLIDKPGFTHVNLDIADYQALADAANAAGADASAGADATAGGVDRVVHLAAQAGVRYSLDHPFAYVQANLVGHMSVLEMCRHLPGFKHLVYASSSSVYGGNTKLPFSVDDRTDKPVSLYAATKKANEHMGHCYSHLYGIPQTGLRFFTVYGPWGRPDMALYIFTKAITEGRPIHVFNHGDMRRDFTYIDDIVAGVIASLDSPPTGQAGELHRVYNIGNHRSEELMRMIEILEESLGQKAEIIFEGMQAGDVQETYADIDAISRDLGFAPTTQIDVGIPNFVKWYRDYHG